MSTEEEKIQKAFDYLLKQLRDYVPDPRHRSMLYSKVEEAQLMHKGLIR